MGTTDLIFVDLTHPFFPQFPNISGRKISFSNSLKNKMCSYQFPFEYFNIHSRFCFLLISTMSFNEDMIFFNWGSSVPALLYKCFPYITLRALQGVFLSFPFYKCKSWNLKCCNTVLESMFLTLYPYLVKKIFLFARLSIFVIILPKI